MLTIRKDDQFKRISNFSWDLMGENKNGWEIVKETEQAVSNEVKTPPPSGEAKKATAKPVDNSAVKNEAAEVKEQAVSNEVKNDVVASTPETATETKASEDFTETAKNINRNTMMDFLDINAISYKKNASDQKLIELLAVHFKNDIVSLKTEFGL